MDEREGRKGWEEKGGEKMMRGQEITEERRREG